MGISFFSKTTRSESALPSLQNSDVNLNLRVSVIDDEIVEKVDVSDATRSYEFITDYEFWKQETLLLSVNNFDNKYFNAIVDRGEDSVPFIFERLKQGPSHLVYALELIYPEKVNYKKDIITLKRARKIWLKILKEQLQR